MKHPILRFLGFGLLGAFIVIVFITLLLECLSLINTMGIDGIGLIILLAVIAFGIAWIGRYVCQKIYDYSHR